MDERILIDRARAALQGLGVQALALKPARGVARRQADAGLRIGKGGAATEYVVEAKNTVTPATLGALLAQMRDLGAAEGKPTLLVADYVTPPVAEALRARGQQFADTAGNAYLKAPGLLVFVTGRKPTAPDARTKAAPAITPNGLKVLFALLCEPELAEAPQRTIAAAAGVALGAVPGVLADLRATGQLLVMGKRRRFTANKRTLDEWAFAYARRLRPKTLDAIYTVADFNAWREWMVDPAQARWGGEPAAALLTAYLKPGALTLYAERLPPKLIVAHRLVKTNALTEQGMLEVRRPFWGRALKAHTRPDTVPPVLVYADLLATGDGRCIETAAMVHERYLARLLPTG